MGGSCKPRGINAGRKLRVHRRLQLWADLGYKKANSGSKWKKPFVDASHAAGIVVEKVAVEAKQPNSGVRKCVRVQLKKKTRFLLLVSVDLDTPRVISLVLDSRSSKLLDAVSVPFGNIRRISHKNEQDWRAYVFPKSLNALRKDSKWLIPGCKLRF